MPLRHFVNVYQLGLEYGGPEEGGWWVTTGEPVYSEGCFTEAFAWFRAEKLSDEYPNNHRYTSVIAHRYDPDYTIYVEDKPGKPWPEEFPHYE